MLARKDLTSHVKSFVLHDHARDYDRTNQPLENDKTLHALHGLISDVRDAVMGTHEFIGALRKLAPERNWVIELGSPASALDAALAVFLLFAENLQSIDVSFRRNLLFSGSEHGPPTPIALDALLPSRRQNSELPSFDRLRSLTIELHASATPLPISILPGLEHIRIVHRSLELTHESHWFPNFQYPTINTSGNLRSMDLTGPVIMPGALAKYLVESDCRSLKSLKVFSDERLLPDWSEPTEHCKAYDFRKLSEALKYAPNLEHFECSFPKGRPKGMFGSFKSLSRLHFFKVDYKLLCESAGQEIGSSLHLQHPTECFPTSLRVLHITDMGYFRLDTLCCHTTKTPSGRAHAVKYVLERVRSLSLRELHLHVRMYHEFHHFNATAKSGYIVEELEWSTRKFLPRLVAALQKEGVIMNVWGAGIMGCIKEVLLYGPGYARAWPQWDRKNEVTAQSGSCDGWTWELFGGDRKDEFLRDPEYVESEDDMDG
ncbi:uncharacterized protein N0V89_006347 [Didymosphaeria variabile]|uniref:Uncharacterized protein n=1 Tax=Didymosphaeria variabile TaxID=1932322 RepID=A0A9W8XMC5_9PLEO|nr:uncharacterized protein N0V89_006347 [Didymosphaeria variabile]KAJ4354610.1 hypothetical protein N0V89_006347 [Didymosphaeria variabile]